MNFTALAAYAFKNRDDGELWVSGFAKVGNDVVPMLTNVSVDRSSRAFNYSTNIRGIRMPGDRVLQQFAEETGGRYFQPFNVTDLDAAFDAINMELRSQYSISYRPSTPRDGKYHEIEIAPQKRGLRVRARRGYFATVPPGFIPPTEPSGSSPNPER